MRAVPLSLVSFDCLSVLISADLNKSKPARRHTSHIVSLHITAEICIILTIHCLRLGKLAKA